jgi:hypothetical protein
VHADDLALTQDGDRAHAGEAGALPRAAGRIREEGAGDDRQARDLLGEEIGDVIDARDAVVALHLDGGRVVVLRAVAVDAGRRLDELEVRDGARALVDQELLEEVLRRREVLHLGRQTRHRVVHLRAEVEILRRRVADEGAHANGDERRRRLERRQRDHVVEHDRRRPRLAEDLRLPVHHQGREVAAREGVYGGQALGFGDACRIDRQLVEPHRRLDLITGGFPANEGATLAEPRDDGRSAQMLLQTRAPNLVATGLRTSPSRDGPPARTAPFPGSRAFPGQSRHRDKNAAGPCALARWGRPCLGSVPSSGKRGSNPRPSAWEADALPTELLPQKLEARAIYFRASRRASPTAARRGYTQEGRPGKLSGGGSKVSWRSAPRSAWTTRSTSA